MTPVTPSEQLRYASDPSPEKTPGEVKLKLSPVDPTQDFHGRSQQTLHLAEQAFAQTGSWVVFFREIFGPEGVVRQLFSDITEREKFQSTEPYRQLQEMLAAIRSQDNSKGDASEPERMITIRLPKSLHEALANESEEVKLSINKLCITKLIQSVESRFVPVQRGRRRGRRPGPQGPRVVSDKVIIDGKPEATQSTSETTSSPAAPQSSGSGPILRSEQ
ncbi:hypothetical protein [Stieleria varia]|uniref:HicB family protein n=1 Tax=Stieleria varia TaxID=2528005 RepID=A0A5C6B5Y7_9BACT|nr:hypothetical protein [Stieleria varia]TWU07695.1 hypothetical protein Pla52n_02680 [Stieleria varia]